MGTKQDNASFLTFFFILGSCPKNWIYLEGSCYKYSSQSLTWSAAKTDCEKMGSMLAVVDSKEKQNAIATQFKNKRFWIGLYRDPKDTSRWLWVDGSRLSFSNWGPGEPNNYRGWFEGCGEVWPSGRWNDARCGLSRRDHLCQMNGWFNSFVNKSVIAVNLHVRNLVCRVTDSFPYTSWIQLQVTSIIIYFPSWL